MTYPKNQVANSIQKLNFQNQNRFNVFREKNHRFMQLFRFNN